MEKIRHQTSETFRLSALLALSGGFQDAYTYNVRDHVFPMRRQEICAYEPVFYDGKVGGSLHYLFPVIAFAMGVFVAERIQQKYKYRSRNPLAADYCCPGNCDSFLVGFIPVQFNMAAYYAGIFSCAMQVQTFRKVHGYGYASTMCIGNLRAGTESLAVYLRDKKPGALKKAVHYYGIILIFAVGAGMGGVMSLHIGLRANLDISGSSDSSLFVDELRKNITSDMLKCRWIYDKINADILENGR